jgi:4-amino-4-deoxy-L-arabinose transferase-like glycosyltransferase
MNKHILVISVILLISVVVRLLYFTGMALGDDVFYTTQALSLAQTGRWPPEPYHWNTRLGVILPTVLCIKTLGAQPLAFVLWPLLASTSSVVVCYSLANELAGPKVARLAAIFQAAFPLEVIYSTHLFPDVLVALFSTLSIWCWIRALRRSKPRDFLASGAFFAAGYLCRETIVMEGPVFLALSLLEGCPRRTRVLWALLVPVLAVSLECGVYARTTGSAFYRWSAIGAQQRNSGNLMLVQSSVSGGNFWTDPLLMIVANHEFGLYHVAGFLIAIVALFQWPSVRPLAVWLLVGFFWTFYGTTVPTRWVTLQRDPRYVASLTVPSLVLLAYWLRLMPRTVRWPVVLVFVGAGLFAAGLDQGQSILAPHRAFAQTKYVDDTTLEPFEYVGAHWVHGLTNPAVFGCASDRGRGSVVRLVNGLDGTIVNSSRNARYFVFSPQRRPDLLTKLREEGWTGVEAIPGRTTPARAFVAVLLKLFPTQRERAERITHPPGLLIMENPRDLNSSSNQPRP